MEIARKSKLRFFVLLSLPLLFNTLPVYADVDLERALDETINQVAEEVGTRLKETSNKQIKNIAVLPLWGNSIRTGYITETIESHLIGGPYSVVDRKSVIWKQLLNEIKWDTLREDTMNPETVQRFGKIAGCDAIIWGAVRECATYPQKNMAITRLKVFLSDVETGETVWSSKEIKKAIVGGEKISTPPTLGPALAKAVNRAVDEAAEKLKAAKLDIKNFAIFPLTEDKGEAVTRILQGELSNSAYKAVPISNADFMEYAVLHSGDIKDVELMRAYAKTKECDAVLYGSVNEIQVLEKRYKAIVRITLNMVDVKGDNIWSPGEIMVNQWRDWQDVIDIAVFDPRVWVVGGIVVLLIIWRAFRKLLCSMFRPR